MLDHVQRCITLYQDDLDTACCMNMLQDNDNHTVTYHGMTVGCQGRHLLRPMYTATMSY